ncbi:hypothetical protein GCM10023324_53400 [Streptomyces youssoufiensis]
MRRPVRADRWRKWLPLPLFLALLCVVTGLSPAWSTQVQAQVQTQERRQDESSTSTDGRSVSRKAPAPPKPLSLNEKKKQARQLAKSADLPPVSAKKRELPWVAGERTPGYKRLSAAEIEEFDAKPRGPSRTEKSAPPLDAKKLHTEKTPRESASQPTRQAPGQSPPPSTAARSAATDWPDGHPYIAHARPFSFESPYIDPGTVTWFATWDVNPNIPPALLDRMEVVVILYRLSDDVVVDVQQWAAWESNGYGTWYNNLLEEGVSYYAEVQYRYADGSVDLITSSPAPAGVNGGVPSSATQGCQGAHSSAGVPRDLHKYCGDPVDTATGALGETVTDAQGIAPGLAFRLSRTYSSLSTVDGVLGKGWVFPYSASLDIGQSVISFLAEDGSRTDYDVNTDGSLTPTLSSVRSTLAKTSTGYLLTAPDQHTLTFDSRGRLTAMRDPAGVGLTFTYTGDLVSAVRDAAGRTTTLAYDDGRLTSVTLPGQGTVRYGYTGGRLTSVTDLRGKTSTYGYDSAGRLTTMTDALGKRRAENTYDSSGRVTAQTNALGGRTGFAYEGKTTTHVTQPDGGIWTYVYSGGVISSKSDPFGKVTRYAYDSSLNRTSVTDARGGTSTTTYDAKGNVLTATAPAPLSHKQTWTYDSRGNVSSYTDGRGNKTSYTHNGANQLTTVTAPDGGKTTHTYNALNELASSTTPRGNKATYTYDTAGNRTSANSPAGHKTTFAYDDAGRVTSLTGPRGEVTSYVYDAAGNVTAQTDPRGGKTTHTYDAVGHLLTTTNPAGGTITHTYDAAGNPLSTTDPSGRTTKQTYDTTGRVTSVTDPAGGRTTRTYDKASRPLTVVTPRGNATGAKPAEYTTSFGYDAAGNRTTVTDPTGAVTSTSYDALNRPTKVTDPLGNATTTAYDAGGNVTKTTDALGKTVTTAYDKNNRATSHTDQLGKVTTYTYDADGNMLTSVSPTGAKTSWTYDADGRRATAVSPRGNATGATPADHTTRYDYDASGNLTTVTDPLGGVRTTEYDAAGNATAMTDPGKRTTTYTYDALNQPVKVTAPDGGTTGYTYNASGDLTQRTDANGHTTGYAYDSAGRLAKTTDPLERTVSYGYDADGNQITRTSGLGTITHTYDQRGLLTKTDHSDASPDLTYGYDAAGRMTLRTNGSLAEDFGYDAVGNLTKTRGFRYTYDAAGNMLTRRYADSNVITYTHDADGRTTSMEVGGATTAYAYDANGDLVRSTLPGGVTEERAYDTARRLTSVTSAKAGKTVTATTVKRDAAGLPVRTDVTRAGVGTGGWDLTYDAAGRLTSGCFPQPWVAGCAESRTTSYTYDKVGNRLTSTLGSASTSYTYDAADQLTSTVSGTTTTDYVHDAEGNQTKAGADTFAYRLNGRIASATVGGTTTDYAHDASGNQVSASQNGTVVRRLQWDPNASLPILTTEYDAAWKVRQSYFHDPLDQVAATRTPAGDLFTYGHDPLGSPLDVFGPTGTLHQRWSYDPYGTRLLNTQAKGAPAVTPAFTGAYHDPGTGNLDLRARQYDTTTGRFTSPDPLTPGQDRPYQSAYAYANNQPTHLTDPSGQCWWIPGSGDGSCWTSEIPGTDLIPLAPAIEAIGDSVVETCKNGASYAKSQGRWAWTGCVDEFTGMNSFRKSADCVNEGQYTRGLMWGLNGVGTSGLWFIGGPGGSATDSLALAAGPKWPINVGNLRFGPGGGGVTPAYGGLPYKTPVTEDLRALVNPQGGKNNCRACAVATDHLLAGKGVSVAPGSLDVGSHTTIEALYGKRFMTSSQSSVVREIGKAGPGARGIVWAVPPHTRPGRAETSHVFNVVNVGGDVIFLDAQSGQANFAKHKIFAFLRTG